MSHEKLEISIYQRFRLALFRNNIRVGWFGAGHTENNTEYCFYIVFHTHPDDGDITELLIKPLLNDFWFFERFKPNRFLLCSKTYQSISQEKKKEFKYIENNFPNLGKETKVEMERIVSILNITEKNSKTRIYCDLFLNCQTNDDILRCISLFDKSFKYNPNKMYSGYLNIRMERINLIPIMNTLNNKKISAFSVPLYYKGGSITKEEAFNIAKDTLKYKNIEPIFDSEFNEHTPLFYSFATIFLGDNPDGFLPNNIRVDKLDGHLWSDFEYCQYMYDFNNKF